MHPVSLSLLGILRAHPRAHPQGPCCPSLLAPPQLCLPTAGLLAQGQYDLDPLPPYPDHVQYTHYSDQIGKPAAHLQAPQPSPQIGAARLGVRQGVGWAFRAVGPGCTVPGASLTLTNSTSLFPDNPDYYDYPGKGLSVGPPAGWGVVEACGACGEGADPFTTSPGRDDPSAA